jgi:2-oxoglutarate dehydrogenase complex dehydrogenase (E1) component-like enzyme
LGYNFSIDRLKELGLKMNTLPEGFVLQRQVQKVIDDRVKMQTGEMPLNWGAAETLAYASLLDDGFWFVSRVKTWVVVHSHTVMPNYITKWMVQFIFHFAISKKINHVLLFMTHCCQKKQCCI